MMRHKWTSFGYFSPGERRALLMILGLSAGFFSFPAAWLPSSGEVTFTTADKEWLESGYRKWQSENTENQQKKKSGGVRITVLHTFDPNRTTREALLGMGIPGRVAQGWARYLEKGGRFKSKEAVRKIYGMEESWFLQLRPWMRIEQERDTFPPSGIKPFRRKPLCVAIEINLADSAAWEQLPGIGPVLAGRIVRFRDRLGGFYGIHQVGETYGLADSVFQRILPCLELSGGHRHLDINQAAENELRSHPYIGYKLARMIMAYRQQHGAFAAPEELLKLPLMDTLTLERLKPYLRK
jgi:competence protein ComEA